MNEAPWKLSTHLVATALLSGKLSCLLIVEEISPEEFGELFRFKCLLLLQDLAMSLILGLDVIVLLGLMQLHISISE